MGEIKSALEIALEKTKGITADKKSLEAEEYVKKGKEFEQWCISGIEHVTSSIQTNNIIACNQAQEKIQIPGKLRQQCANRHHAGQKTVFHPERRHRNQECNI